MESRRDKFERLANSRVNKAIKAIRIVGNLSNKNTYEFSDADIQKIFRALDSELKSTRKRFDSSNDSEEPTFKL